MINHHRQKSTLRGSRVTILSTIGILLWSIQICQPLELDKLAEWKYPQMETVNPSIISGIRGLEYVKRFVIDNLRIRNTEDRESLFIDNEESDEQKYFGNTIRKDDNIGRKHQPRQANSAMYEALSRLAKVRTADPRIVETSRGKSFNGEEYEPRNPREPANVENNPETWKRQDARNTTKNVSTSYELTQVLDSSRSIKRKFQCSPIDDIYIPNVEKKMPAHLCALGRKAFIVSSERFNQENRERFFISLDDETYMRLNPISSGTNTLTSAVSVLPATLVLKRGEDDYAVRGIRSDSQSTPITEHRF